MQPRPSSAGRWLGGGCRGSVALEARYPQTASEDAENGKRLHGLAAGVLQGITGPLSDDDDKVVRPYVTNLRAELARRPGAVLEVEKRKTWSLRPEFGGTPDAALYDTPNKHIIIWDLKTGWRIVDVVWNWQLICYALMVAVRGWTVELRIAQPLPYHLDGPIRSWLLTWEQVQQQGPVVAAALKEALSDDPPLRPGRHCLYCAALAACPAVRDVAFAAIDYAKSEPVETPDEYVGRELSVLRETVKILELRTAALEESVASKLREGMRIPGVYMEEGRGGRVKWDGDETQIRATLQLLTGVDPAIPKLPTPTQMKDAGVPPQLLQPFTKYQPGKMVVSTEANDQAKKAFGHAPQTESKT